MKANFSSYSYAGRQAGGWLATSDAGGPDLLFAAAKDLPGTYIAYATFWAVGNARNDEGDIESEWRKIASFEIPDEEIVGKTKGRAIIEAVKRLTKEETLRVERGTFEEMDALLKAIANCAGKDFTVHTKAADGNAASVTWSAPQAAKDIVTWHQPTGGRACADLNTSHFKKTGRTPLKLHYKPGRPASAHERLEARAQLERFYEVAGNALHPRAAPVADRIDEAFGG